MYPNLTGDGNVEPSTYLYARGVRYLQQSFGGQEITQKLLDEELQKITEAYEEIIEELETEEQYCPLKILGIPMTDSFVTTVLGSILTVIMIPANPNMSNQEGLTLQLVLPDNIEFNEILVQEKPIMFFHQHFSCAEHDHEPENLESPQRENIKNVELWESDTYRYEFNLSILINSLIVFLIDISGLGLIIDLYKKIFGSTYLRNLCAIGRNIIPTDSFGLINLVFLLYSIWQRDFIYADASGLLYMVELVFFSIMGAALYSYMNSKIPSLMRETKFSQDGQIRVWYLAKAPESSELGWKKDFKRTILRLNIDASSFFMTFLDKTEGDERFRRIIDPSNQDILQKEGDKLIINPRIGKSDLITMAPQFEEAVFDYKFLGKPSRFDDKAYGYTYADDILSNYNPYAPGFILLFIFAVVGIIALSFINLDGSEHSSEGFVKKYIIGGLMLLLNISVTIRILKVMRGGSDILWTRLDLVKGLAELISEETPPKESRFRKYCSMINIFDGESLRTWASLRMVFMNMDQRELEAISLGISMIVAIQVIVIATLGFFYFTATEAGQKDFFLQYLIFFGAPAIFYMSFLLLFIYVGSQVNNQYQKHIYLLKKLKMTIFKLFAMYPNLNGQGNIQPSTYLYARGFRYLKESFGDQEVTEELLDKKLQKINESYDEVITELETEEQFSPLKILGIPMTGSFVTTVLGSIVTVMMIPASKYLADLTGWG